MNVSLKNRQFFLVLPNFSKLSQMEQMGYYISLKAKFYVDYVDSVILHVLSHKERKQVQKDPNNFRFGNNQVIQFNELVE